MPKRIKITELNYNQILEKRGFKFIDTFPKNTKIKVKWQCKLGHVWKSTYSNISRHGGCPYCSGNIPKIETDYLILAEKRNIKFIGPKPQNVIQKTLWLCNCGTTFESSYHKLTSRKFGCRNCAIKSTALQNFAGYKEISQSYWNRTRKGARTRNLEFNISIEDAFDIFIKQNRKCALSKIDISLGITGSKYDMTASIDRIDSSRGYTKDNIQWLHKDINTIKWDLKQDYFIFLCKTIASNN